LFPAALNALSKANATNVTPGLTTLEQVFLAIRKEESEISDAQDNKDLDDDASSSELLNHVWGSKGRIVP
jgi:hypothetical protein